MDRHDVYKNFWSSLVLRAKQRPELREVHERMGQAKSCQDQYLQTRYNGNLYRYNIWWQQDNRACASINLETEWVNHGYGRLQEMDAMRWPEVQDRMIEAMVNLARERRLI
jgi:hypothetical protein